MLKCNNAKMQQCKNVWMRKCNNAKMQQCENVTMRKSENARRRLSNILSSLCVSAFLYLVHKKAKIWHIWSTNIRHYILFTCRIFALLQLYIRFFASKFRKHEEATQSNFDVFSCFHIFGFEEKREYEWRKSATIDMRFLENENFNYFWKMKILTFCKVNK
jgi:hypothetical protein